MPKRSPKKTPARAKAPARKGYSRLVTAIESANLQMTGRAASLVNQTLVIRNWLIGAYIVEYEQGGADRAKYGARLLEQLAKDLEKRGLKGLGRSILERCRAFFLAYPQVVAAIPETLSTELKALPFTPLKIPYTPSTESGNASIPARNSTRRNQTEQSAPLVQNSPVDLPVGIILCSNKDGTEVEFATAGMDSQMFVSRYLVALPSAEQLRKFVEADRARIELATDPV